MPSHRHANAHDHRHRRPWPRQRGGASFSGVDRTRVEVWREASRLDGISIAPDFTSIVRTPQLSRLMRASLSNGAVVIAAVSEETLHGYTLIVPSPLHVHERWHDLPDLFELSLEVAHSARRRHVASSLLDALADAVPIRSVIVFGRAFFGHWDFVAAGLDPPAYRRMLVKGLGRVGFVHCDTDDAEVQEHPLNFLAARFGEDARASSLLAFKERLRVASRLEQR